MLEQLLAGKKALLGYGRGQGRGQQRHAPRSVRPRAALQPQRPADVERRGRLHRAHPVGRTHLPADGQAALPVLKRLLKAKPLVDLLGKEAASMPGQEDGRV